MISRHILVVFAVASAALVKADCYDHEGTFAMDSPNYKGKAAPIPCGRGSNNCCMPGHKCGTNLLCIATGAESMSRQYCSREDWQGCSNLLPELSNTNVWVQQCGRNIVCYNATKPKSQTCCTDGGPTFFVDPDTGDVKDGKVGGSDASPSYWPVAAELNASIESAMQPRSTSTVEAVTTATEALPTLSEALSSDTGAPLPSDTSGAQQEPSRSGLSGGVSAGIGVGCAVGVIGVVLLGWLCVRMRKGKRNVSELPADGNSHWQGKPFVHEVERSDVVQRHELSQDRQRQEMY